MSAADRFDASRAALLVYDACRRALTPADPARRASMRPALDAWVTLIGACRARAIPVIYTTPVSRADGADVVLLPTDLSVQTGVPSLTNCVEGTPEAGFPDEIAPAPQDYVYLKRRPSAFYGTGVAELLRTLRRTALVIGGGATNRGVETSVREAFSMRASARSSRRWPCSDRRGRGHRLAGSFASSCTTIEPSSAMWSAIPVSRRSTFRTPTTIVREYSRATIAM